MSSEQTFSNADLRKTAQDYKRDNTRKHKWQFGAVERVGRGEGNPRPHRPSETQVVRNAYFLNTELTSSRSLYNMKRREAKGAVASLAHGAKLARKRDMLDGPADFKDIANDIESSSSHSSDCDECSPAPAPDAGVMYSFDAPRGPSHGSEILNVALAKAVQKFEEKETARIVKDEYDIIDSEGESIGLSPVKKGKGKAKLEALVVPDEDDDYEFV